MIIIIMIIIIIIIIALIINDFPCAKLAITPLYPALLRPKFFFVLCVCVWGGWLRGVNDPRAGFVRFCTQGGGKMSYKGGGKGLKIMY